MELIDGEEMMEEVEGLEGAPMNQILAIGWGKILVMHGDQKLRNGAAILAAEFRNLLPEEHGL